MKLLNRAGWMLAAAIGAATMAGTAQAGDLARPEVIGFSRDGAYVAYEEYGEQDASGAPYSNIFIIDVAANAWVEGAPIRVLLNDEVMPNPELEEDPLGQARLQAMAEAQPLLDQYSIVPGETGSVIIQHPRSDVDAPTHEVSFSIGLAYSPYSQDMQTLTLTESEVANAECDQYDWGPVAMMSLELERGGLGAPIMLQQDTDLPASRGCTTGYRIHSVIVYTPDVPEQHTCCHRDEVAMLVIVSMSQFGFEGPDWRNMGVTAMLSPAW